MLEILLIKTRQAVSRHGPRLLRWLGIVPLGLWLTVLVCLLIGGRLAWLAAHRPAHTQALAAAYGSIRQFFGVPQLSHSGRQFTFVATSDKGYALFLCDTATGHREIVCEQSGLGRFREDHDVQGSSWSPDDSAFIYTTANKLFICPADATKFSMATALDVPSPAISEVVWINPAAFVFRAWGALYCARKHPDERWKVQPLSHFERASNLTGVGSNTLAWLENNAICRATLADDLNDTKDPFAASPVDSHIQPPTNHLQLWVDASILNLADQQPVTNLADLSPAKNDLVTNGMAPLYNAPGSQLALNGKGTIHFDSHDPLTNSAGLKTSRLAGVTGAVPRSVFAVLRRDGQAMMVSLGNYGGPHAGYFGVLNFRGYLMLPTWGDAHNPYPQLGDDGHTQPAGSWNLLETIYDGTNQDGYVGGNFTSRTSFRVNTDAKEVEIGQRTGIGGAGSDGDFAELLIYDRALDTAERQQVEEYLSAKWFGIQPQFTKIWYAPPLSGITGFSYAKATGQFLLQRTDNGRNSLWRYTPDVTRTNLVQLGEAASITYAQWMGETNWVYLGQEGGQPAKVVTDALATEDADATITKLNQGNFTWLAAAPDGRRFFCQGTLGDEPAPGIWQYDFASENMQPVVPYGDHPDPQARRIDPLSDSVNLPTGPAALIIYPPANFDRYKKYPLVIGATPVYVVVNGPHGRQWAPAMASCGAYVAVVNRPGWDESIEQWGTDAALGCQQLLQNPCIDTNQLFLYGASAETKYMSDFVAQAPGRWKGVILFNPTELPDFSNSPKHQTRPKILISAGGEEHEAERLKKYQQDALKAGVLTEVVIAPGEGHHFVGNAAQLERTKALIHFIFEE